MTRQRWWDAYRLGKIRHGIMMGMYHRAAGYSCSRDNIVFRRDTRMTTPNDYERGLVHGYDAPTRLFARLPL